jgi:hypothetical protein
MVRISTRRGAPVLRHGWWTRPSHRHLLARLERELRERAMVGPGAEHNSNRAGDHAYLHLLHRTFSLVPFSCY